MATATLLIALAGALVGSLLVALVAAPAAESYEKLGFRWKGSPAVIKYHSLLKTEGDKWALSKALTAWNQQDFKVNFKRVSRDNAKLIVQRDRYGYCGTGYAPYLAISGYAKSAKVVLGNCPDSERYLQAHVASHELGHVLGLDHENDVCAQMNSFNLAREPYWAHPKYCAAPPSGSWRCRLVNRDDARGVRSIYGGSFALTQEFCPFGATAQASASAKPGPTRTIDLSDDVEAEPAR